MFYFTLLFQVPLRQVGIVKLENLDEQIMTINPRKSFDRKVLDYFFSKKICVMDKQSHQTIN